MTIEAIGIIKTPFSELEDMPIQPKGAAHTIATLEIRKSCQEGLKDLEDFSHIYILYHFHKTSRSELSVIPFMDTQIRGVFSTRSPLRPSHIGMSITKIISVCDNIVTVEGIDVLDGTPLLDIKPYIPQFDSVENVKTGWMDKEESEVIKQTADSRFI